MEITSFNNSVEIGILHPPHVVKVNPLHREYRLGLSIEHCVILILVKEGPEAFISALSLGLEY
jgi:hypothetical protein